MLQSENIDSNLYHLPDSRLIELSKKNEKAAYVLVSRYLGIVSEKARVLSRGRPEIREDLEQEGLLALLKAVNTYKPENGELSAYLSVCAANKIKTALKKSSRTEFLTDTVVEGYDLDSPERILMEKETVKEIENVIENVLSELEKNVFRLFLRGSSYEQTANQLNISPKTVDNALQRVRRKLKSVWRADNISD